MALSIADLQSAVVKLAPVEISLDGTEEKVLIHRFTWAQFDVLLEADKDIDRDNYVTRQVIRLMSGPGVEPTEEQVSKLQNLFTAAQILDLYTQGLAANGFGRKAQKEAEKK